VNDVVMESPRGGPWRALVPLAQALQKDDMRRLGQRRTSAIARRLNRRGERFIRFRREASDELLPRGVRLMESSAKFDPDADGPWRESQLYHLDYHSSPTVYVIVALRDIGPDDGPLHFLGKSASRRVVEALDYGARGVPYRLTDADVYAIVDESEVHRFSVPAGTVLFIESSACFHFGSRRPAKPRFQMQFGFTSPVRNDFLELWRPQRVFPVGPADSDLRKLVLDRSLLSLNQLGSLSSE
jgi:hypothetical protein